MQFKTKIKYHFIPPEWRLSIRVMISSICTDVEKLGPSYIIGGDAKWCE